MRSELGDIARLKHILDAASEIQSYLSKTDFEEFAADSMKKHATVKQLEIIGEAANHLSEVIKEKHPEIEWKEIIGLRHILIHEYFGIDEKIVWSIIEQDLPKLKHHIAQILTELE